MKNSKTALILSLSALCSLQSALTFGQEPAGKEIELEKLVISASRSNTTLKDLPADVSVIQQPQLERTNPLTFDDFVNRAMPVPDMNGFFPVRGSVDRHVNLRGLGGGPFMRTRVILDGMPLNDPQTNFVDWNLIPLDAVDRVEVLEGPLSSLYGSGAVGGVINIVTRQPQKASESLGKASYGSLSTLNTGAVQSGKIGGFSYLLAAHDYQTNGYVAEQNPGPLNVPRERRKVNLYSRLGFQAGDSINLGFIYLHGNGDNSRGDVYSRLHDVNHIGQLSATGQGDKLSWVSQFHVTLHDRDAFNTTYPAPTALFVDSIQSNLAHEYGGDGHVSYQVSDGVKFTAGVEGARNASRLDTAYQPLSASAGRQQTAEGKQSSIGTFGQGEFKALGEKLVATLAGRGDWFRDYNGSFIDTTGSVNKSYEDKHFAAFSPKAGLLYHATEDVALRASGGRSFRAPPFIFLFGDNRQGGATIQGNPALTPEYLWSYDVGTDVKLGRGSLAKVTFYQNWATDFFTQKNLNQAGTQRTFANATAVHMLGATAEVDYRLADQWNLRTGYAYERSRVTDNPDPTLIGTDLVDVPRNKYMAGVGYTNPSILSVDVTARYKDKAFADTANVVPTSPYWNFDLAAWRKIGELVTARLDVQNLFNNQYDSPGGPIGLTVDPGRLITGTLQVAF